MNAQKLNIESHPDRFYYENNKYHKETGWVNAIGIHTGNWDEIYVSIEGIPELPSLQIDYQLYKLVKPRIGLGAGAALNYSPTGQHGYEELSHYKFAEFYAYGKYFITNTRRRLFVDAKFGYAHALDKFKFSCYTCDGEGPLFLRYTSGSTMQAGVGLEFATSRLLKWGIKLSYYQNAITEQSDIHPNSWKKSPDGIIKRQTSDTVLKRFLLGFNFYI